MKKIISLFVLCMAFGQSYAIFDKSYVSKTSSYTISTTNTPSYSGTKGVVQKSYGNTTNFPTKVRSTYTSPISSSSQDRSSSSSSVTPQVIRYEPNIIVNNIHSCSTVLGYHYEPDGMQVPYYSTAAHCLPDLREQERPRREAELERQRLEREYESRLREQELQRQRYQNDLERQERERLLQQQRLETQYQSRLREEQLQRQRYQNELERQERERQLQADRIRRQIEVQNRERQFEAQRIQNEYERQQREYTLQQNRYAQDLRRAQAERDLEAKRLRDAAARQQRELDLELQRKGYYSYPYDSHSYYAPYNHSAYTYTHDIGEGYVYIR